MTILNRFQLSGWNLSRQHLSISGISQLLLVWFWPNFKSRFLETFITYTNCHSDICPGNICPYQGYFSCYWPNFNQTFLTQLFESLIFLAQNFAWPKFFGTFNLKKFRYKIFVGSKLWENQFQTSVHLTKLLFAV